MIQMWFSVTVRVQTSVMEPSFFCCQQPLRPQCIAHSFFGVFSVALAVLGSHLRIQRKKCFFPGLDCRSHVFLDECCDSLSNALQSQILPDALLCSEEENENKMLICVNPPWKAVEVSMGGIHTS
jgi:hypothetical protein